MEKNAYKEKVLKINGKEIIIPETLTFSQILSCEMKGLQITELQDKPLLASTIIYSVLAKVSLETATEELDCAFKEGLKVTDFINDVLPVYANFFAQNSN